MKEKKKKEIKTQGKARKKHFKVEKNMLYVNQNVINLDKYTQIKLVSQTLRIYTLSIEDTARV